MPVTHSPPPLSNNAPHYSQSLLEKASHIKLLICDVDGVLTNGKIYYVSQGEEFKCFNVKDGLGIKHLLSNDVQLAIITGRRSPMVDKRAKELGIPFVYQGQKDKQQAYQDVIELLNLSKEQVAYVGDDLPDLSLMLQSGLGICVADSHYFVQQNADWITQCYGGHGAVREISDLLLFAQDKLQAIHQQYQVV